LRWIPVQRALPARLDEDDVFYGGCLCRSVERL